MKLGILFTEKHLINAYVLKYFYCFKYKIGEVYLQHTFTDCKFSAQYFAAVSFLAFHLFYLL